eukprot:13895167-Alexandrium_andersonii.AAC.1
MCIRDRPRPVGPHAVGRLFEERPCGSPPHPARNRSGGPGTLSLAQWRHSRGGGRRVPGQLGPWQ